MTGTTLLQSRKLLELGIDPKTAGMCWSNASVRGVNYMDAFEQAPKNEEHIYNLQLTERQAQILSYACDRLSRIICGQNWTYQEFMEEAWEKRCKEATGKVMDDEWDGGWHNMRAEAEEICMKIKKRFWGVGK